VNYRKDGPPFDLEWTIAPIRDAAGTITHFIAVQRDVSERVETARHPRRALIEALAADRAKAALLTVVTHELRSPLDVILGHAELIAGQAASTRWRSVQPSRHRAAPHRLRLGSHHDRR
jgi:signal transduction histidine kinase